MKPSPLIHVRMSEHAAERLAWACAWAAGRASALQQDDTALVAQQMKAAEAQEWLDGGLTGWSSRRHER